MLRATRSVSKRGPWLLAVAVPLWPPCAVSPARGVGGLSFRGKGRGVAFWKELLLRRPPGGSGPGGGLVGRRGIVMAGV